MDVFTKRIRQMFNNTITSDDTKKPVIVDTPEVKAAQNEAYEFRSRNHQYNS